MAELMEIVVAPDGVARCVYAEDVDLAALGEVDVRRASHVEPDPAGRWWADLSPVAGPTLGPFNRRSEALAAETRWLAEHWLGVSRPACPTPQGEVTLPMTPPPPGACRAPARPPRRRRRECREEL